MDNNRKHNYNGRSRHQSSDERGSRMEMTKLIANPERGEKCVSKPGLKACTSIEGVKLSLHQCARDGSESELKTLLKCLRPQLREKINQHDEEQLTPLHYAARYNRLNIVKLLVEAGADVQAVGKNDTTPLHHAASFRCNEKIREVSSDEDVCEPPPPPPEMDVSEEEVESERLVEAYRAWEDRESVSLDNIDDSELLREMVTSEPVRPNHSEQDKGGSVVTYLVNKGANINALDARSQTPLHYAARRGNEVACTDLLAFKATIKTEASDEQDITPLHIAIIHRQVEIARMLIDNDAFLMCQDKKKFTPLHYASMEGSVDLVQIMFEATIKRKKPWLIREMISAEDVMSSTPLHVAAENGYYEVVKQLLEKHSEVNRPRRFSMYPLHLAAQLLDASIAKLLLDSHANIEAVNEYHETALHIASAWNSVEVARLLLERGANKNPRDLFSKTPLLTAACKNNGDMVKLLLDTGADFTVADVHDKTAVFLAAERNHMDVLKELLSHSHVKRLINERDYWDNYPVHAAADNGHLEILQFLKQNGADINSKNEREQTPLHLASKSGRINIVRELIELNPCIVYTKDVNFNTSLHLAAQQGKSQVVKLLLDKGSSIFARNDAELTPLDLAASNGWTRTCQVLLHKYPFVSFTDKAKTTPLHLASQNGHAHVVDMLLKTDADLSFRDENGKTCLDVAIDANQADVAMVIVNSLEWKSALRNVTRNPDTNQIETPMRKLIRKMPDVALRVFNRCTNQDSNNELTFDYEFLEDLYALWFQKGLKNIACFKRSDLASTSGNVWGDQTEDISAELYFKDANVIKENHPLFIMILSERESLLEHPLVTTLLQHKWNTFGRFFYYLSFFIYIIFLLFLTAYMLTTDPPHLFGADAAVIEDNQCVSLTKPYQQSLCASIGTYVIIALAGFNMLKELFQIYQAKLKYFGWTNLIEWIVYVTSLLFVVSFNECQRITGYRYVWQWNLGALSVFLVWFNLVLFIRKFPKFGIYVVMFTDMVRTFSQFFVVFSLFIVAYAMAFYATFQNKAAFATIPSSVIKTYVMMTGEVEFDEIFHNQESSGVYYPEVSYILFIIFLTSMSIIVMNLLVGLAVSDIKTVQAQAALKRMAMQVELALDVERILPDFIRQKAFCQKKTMSLNVKLQEPIWKILLYSCIKTKAIKKALTSRRDANAMLNTGQEKLSAEMSKFKQSIKGVRKQNHKLESMLKIIMESQNIRAHVEDYKEDEDSGEEDSEIDEKHEINEIL